MSLYPITELSAVSTLRSMARNAVPPPCAKASIATTTFGTIGRSWTLCQTTTSGAKHCPPLRMPIPYKCRWPT